MPYLNWKEHRIGHSMEHTGSGSGRADGLSVARMQLDLDSAELEVLVQQLEQVFAPAEQSGSAGNESHFSSMAAELRVDLPDQWIVFWKKRASDTRLLLAHPQEDEWVATAALEETHGQNLVSALKKLSSGQGISIHELGADLYESGSVNNLELRLTLK
jgi:hypothetical protein